MAAEQRARKPRSSGGRGQRQERPQQQGEKPQTDTDRHRQMLDLNRALAITNPQGKCTRIQTPVKLSVAQKTLTNTFSAIGIIVSAEGFIALSGKSGLLTNMANLTVIADGKEQPNGYRDQNGLIYYKAQCGGVTPLGQVYVSEATVSFDLQAYITQDLLAKQAKHPDAFKLLPRRAAAPGEEWADYPLDMSMTLWIDSSYPETYSWMKDIQQQKKFGDRKAQQMARRNAIKAHPSIVELGIGKIQQAEITVWPTLWVTESGPLRLDASIFSVDVTAKLIEAGATVVPVNDGKVIDVTGDEEELAAARAETDVAEPADAPAEGPPPQAEGPPATGDEDDGLPVFSKDDLISQLGALVGKGSAKQAAYEKARSMCDIADTATDADLSEKQLSELIRLVKMA